MNKRSLNILIIIICVLLAVFAFDILNTESHYEGLQHIKAPQSVLDSSRHMVALMEALTGFGVIALTFLVYIKNKKGRVNALPH